MNFIECPKCKKEIQEEFDYCPYCKTRITNKEPKVNKTKFNKTILCIMIISLFVNVFQAILYFSQTKTTNKIDYKNEMVINNTESKPIKTSPQNDENVTQNNNDNSEFDIEWVNGEDNFTFGSGTSIAEVLGASVVKSNDGDYLLVIDFNYTNTLEESRNFINDTYCNVMVFQNGIELNSPGITSEKNLYDYGDAFTQIKNGASIQTQLVWELRDTTNPLEIEFGWMDAKILKTVSIVKK
jgi:hypothetical protein